MTDLIDKLTEIKHEPDTARRAELIDKLISKLSHRRDINQFRQFWLMAEKVAENTDDPEWDTAEKVVSQCKIETRFIKHWFFYPNPKKPEEQKLQLELRSISFEECSQEDFDAFNDSALKIMARKLNITVSELLRG